MNIEECKNIEKKIIATSLELETILDNLHEYELKDRLTVLKNYKKKVMKDNMLKCVRDFFSLEVKGF